MISNWFKFPWVCTFDSFQIYTTCASLTKCSFTQLTSLWETDALIIWFKLIQYLVAKTTIEFLTQHFVCIMSDRCIKMVSVIFFVFFVKQDKRVNSWFWLINLCNSEKKFKIGLHGGEQIWKTVFGIQPSAFSPSVSFCSASAKNFHLGASCNTISTWRHTQENSNPATEMNYYQKNPPFHAQGRRSTDLISNFRAKVRTAPGMVLDTVKPTFQSIVQNPPI